MAPDERPQIAPFPDGFLPKGTAGIISLGFGDPATLCPDEVSAVARAALKRAREFAAGRHAARLALERLGANPVSIPVGADRAPQWPAGIVGSISHTDRCSAAVVAYSRDLAGLGIDVERSEPLASRLCSKILTEPETRRLSLLSGREPLEWAKIAFSAKESLYKCYRPITGSFLAFHDVDLSIFPDEERLEIRVIRSERPAALGARRFAGRYALRGDYVFTVVALPSSGRVAALW